VGDTVNQVADGGETDHFKAPLPALLIFTTCAGNVVPTYPLTLRAVGVTASTACADTGTGITRPAMTTANRRTTNRWSVIDVTLVPDAVGRRTFTLQLARSAVSDWAQARKYRAARLLTKSP